MENPASSRIFTDKLLMRLKSGDTRSIHLNALPGPFARIDVYDLIYIDASLHLKFLNTLLCQRAFRFALHIDPQLIPQKEPEARKVLQRLVKKLNHLYYQEKEELAEHGYTSFAFGYPLLVKRDPANPERIIKAPVFIWYISIEKDRRSNNTWILSRSEEQPVIFNEALRTHLQTQEHIRTEELDALLQEEHLDEKQLLEACRILASQLHIPYDAESPVATLLPGTNKESIEQLIKEHSRIRFSGIFGLYKTQKQAIIRDLEQLQEKNVTEPKYEGHLSDIADLCPVPLDPSQEEILHGLKKHNDLVIQGPPGTGKSQSLTGIISTALLNGRTTLVVCEKRTALDVLHQNLSKLGLQDLCVLIEDVYADRKKIVERVRDRLETDAPPERFREHAYEETRSDFLSRQEEINHRLNIVRNLFFGDDGWAELLVKELGLRHDAEAVKRSAQIRERLKQVKFEYTFPEFQSIRKRLTEAETVYKALPADVSGFEVLADEALLQKKPSGLSADLGSLLQLAKQLSGSLEKNQSEPAYDRLSGFRRYIDRLRAVFSENKKQQLEQQAADLQRYKDLQTQLKANGILIVLQPEIPQHYMHEIYGSLKQLENQLEQFTGTPADLHAYQVWRNFLHSCDKPLRAVSEALQAIRASDWQKVFTAFYYDAFIRHTADLNGLNREAGPDYQALGASDNGLRELLPARIRQLWHTRQQEALNRRDTAQLKYLYNQRKNKQFETRNSLRRIVHADAELFRTLFPVTLVNPVSCASVFPLESGLYDLVILDEASQLKIEETFSSLFRGKSRIVSGDKHQMPPSTLFGNTVLFDNEEGTDDKLESFLAESHSLLEFANDAGFPNHYLDFHYRSRHPQLIAFSNAAFYQNRLVPMPQRNDYQPFFFYDVQGIYRDGTNPEEARRVADFLFNLEKNGDTYPSVGVATFNIFQRDLILDLLWEKAYADTVSLAKLEALFQQGLFVKNLENIQGDERDVMILSTTFGRDEQGKFRQFFGPLTQEKGYQLLNVIVTRAKTAVHVFCSVPETVFINYREELLQKGNTGKAIFYAYLAWAKACATGDHGQQSAILESLGRNVTVKSPQNAGGQDRPLSKHMYEELKQQYGDAVRLDHPFGGFILPVALLKSGKPILCIETDEPDGYGTDVIYRVKLHREAMLKGYGISTIQVWGYEYWQDPELKLALISETYENT